MKKNKLIIFLILMFIIPACQKPVNKIVDKVLSENGFSFNCEKVSPEVWRYKIINAQQPITFCISKNPKILFDTEANPEMNREEYYNTWNFDDFHMFANRMEQRKLGFDALDRAFTAYSNNK